MRRRDEPPRDSYARGHPILIAAGWAREPAAGMERGSSLHSGGGHNAGARIIHGRGAGAGSDGDLVFRTFDRLRDRLRMVRARSDARKADAGLASDGPAG